MENSKKLLFFFIILGMLYYLIRIWSSSFFHRQVFVALKAFHINRVALLPPESISDALAMSNQKTAKLVAYR